MSDRAPKARGGHLVFIHGGGVGPWMWREAVELLGRDREVHLPTLPGHVSGRAEQYTTHGAAAEHLAGQIGLPSLEGPVTVLGFSAGGQVAMELAARYPEQIGSAVIVSSLASPLPASRALARLGSCAAPLAGRRWFARAQAASLGIPDADFEAYFALSSSMPWASLENLLRENFTFRTPSGFTQPALLLAGSKEPGTLVKGLRDLAEARPGRRLEIVKGAGHSIPLTRAGEFATSVETWLAEHGKPATKPHGA